MKKTVVTGSSDLIGTEVARFFHEKGFRAHWVDNNQRAVFSGSQDLAGAVDAMKILITGICGFAGSMLAVTQTDP